MGDAEIKPSNDEWRARYGKIDPFAIVPFVEYRGRRYRMRDGA